MVLLDIYSVLSGYNKANIDIKQQNLSGIVNVYVVSKGQYNEGMSRVADIQKDILGRVKLGIAVFHLRKLTTLKELEKMRNTIFKNYIVVKYRKGITPENNKITFNNLISLTRILHKGGTNGSRKKTR